jgi:hypothetical protein
MIWRNNDNDSTYVLINFELGSEPMIVEELRRLTL